MTHDLAEKIILARLARLDIGRGLVGTPSTVEGLIDTSDLTARADGLDACRVHPGVVALAARIKAAKR